MHSSVTRIRIAEAELPDEGQTLTLTLTIMGRDERAFLLRYRGGLYAYFNRCPHWNVDLDMGDERFFAQDIERIYCKNHGAIFDPENGLCLAGPCAGLPLTALRVTREDGFTWVEWEPTAVIC